MQPEPSPPGSASPTGAGAVFVVVAALAFSVGACAGILYVTYLWVDWLWGQTLPLRETYGTASGVAVVAAGLLAITLLNLVGMGMLYGGKSKDPSASPDDTRDP